MGNFFCSKKQDRLRRNDTIYGQKVYRETFFTEGRPVDDILYEEKNGKKTLLKRKLLFYSSTGKLLRELIVASNNILLQEKQILFDAKQESADGYEVHNFIDNSVGSYNSWGQNKELVFKDGKGQTRRYFYEYAETGLLLSRGFEYQGKVSSKFCVSYEYY